MLQYSIFTLWFVVLPNRRKTKTSEKQTREETPPRPAARATRVAKACAAVHPSPAPPLSLAAARTRHRAKPVRLWWRRGFFFVGGRPCSRDWLVRELARGWSRSGGQWLSVRCCWHGVGVQGCDAWAWLARWCGGAPLPRRAPSGGGSGSPLPRSGAVAGGRCGWDVAAALCWACRRASRWVDGGLGRGQGGAVWCPCAAVVGGWRLMRACKARIPRCFSPIWWLVDATSAPGALSGALLWWLQWQHHIRR